VKFLRDWLKIDRPSGVALHASQTIDLQQPYAAAFERCIHGIENVLGGVIREADERRGRIEATFGLINSERLSCTLGRVDDAHTRILIESRRGATPQPARSSQYVRALAEFLQSASG
jgi:hypothetical protein